jgi:hypothetical protein
MDVNKFQILRQGGVSKQVNIPIELTWDYNGLDDAIDEYEVKIIEEVLVRVETLKFQDSVMHHTTAHPYTSTLQRDK